MWEGKLSYNETARRFEVNDHHGIQDWERIYLTEYPEYFALEPLGCGNKGHPPNTLLKQVEENLLAEVQRLRAREYILINLQALVLKDERRRRKERRQFKDPGKSILKIFFS